MLALPVAFLLLAFLTRHYRPSTVSARLLRCWTLGTVLLLTWNLLPLPHLGVNPFSSLLTGALELPGLPLVLCLNLLE